MAEEAVYENAGTFSLPPDQQWDPQPPGTPAPPAPGGIQAALSGPSRLVFTIPQGEMIPYTLDGLLEAMRTLPPSLSALVRWKPPGCNPIFVFNPTAARRPPVIGFPGRTITAIEAPYRLILSPDEKGQVGALDRFTCLAPKQDRALAYSLEHKRSEWKYRDAGDLVAGLQQHQPPSPQQPALPYVPYRSRPERAGAPHIELLPEQSKGQLQTRTGGRRPVRPVYTWEPG
jgi:hypothetical protein